MEVRVVVIVVAQDMVVVVALAVGLRRELLLLNTQ
jgi:hypothetical protein